MGQKLMIGLIAIAIAIGLVRYAACNKPSVGPKPSDPAVAAAVDDLLASWDRVESFYAAVESLISNAAGNEGRTTGKGKYYLQKRDGKTLIYFEMKNVLTIHQEGGQQLLTAEILQWVIDGKNLYTFTNQPDFMQAAKKKLDYKDVLLFGGRPLFRDLLANNMLTLQPEEMLDGRAARVILATPKDGKWTTRHYFDKTTGIRLKMEEVDAVGKTTLKISLVDLDLTSSISDEKFVFTVPEGVPFVDETAQKP